MDQEVKRINNKDQLRQIVEKLFLDFPVQMKNQDGDLPVKIISFSDPILEVSHEAPPSEIRNLHTTRADNSMVLECKVESRSGNIEKLIPMNLHLTRMIRQQPRLNIQEKDKKLLWVTNLITQRNFPDYFSSANEKRDALIKAYKTQLSKNFVRVEVVLRLSVRIDYRMRTLLAYRKPIFVPDIMKPETIDPNNFVPFSEYQKLLRYEKIQEGIAGEITEPLLYKKFVLLGYIRVLSENKITMENYETVHRAASELLKNLEAYGALPVNREKSPVVDINLIGVGCMHPHVPAVIRNFMPGENVVFDIHFIEGTVMTYTGVIKNMKSGERAHRLGIQFDPLENEQLYPLQEFLAQLTSGSNAEVTKQKN